TREPAGGACWLAHDPWLRDRRRRAADYRRVHERRLRLHRAQALARRGCAADEARTGDFERCGSDAAAANGRRGDRALRGDHVVRDRRRSLADAELPERTLRSERPQLVVRVAELELCGSARPASEDERWADVAHIVRTWKLASEQCPRPEPAERCD